jgi:hypothetical protein
VSNLVYNFQFLNLCRQPREELMSHLFQGISLPLRPLDLQHYFSCETNEKQCVTSCGTIEKQCVTSCGTNEKQCVTSCGTNEKQCVTSWGTNEKQCVTSWGTNEKQCVTSCGTAEKQQPKEKHSVSSEVNEKQQQQARQRKHKHTAPKQQQHQLQQQHNGEKQCSGQLILKDLISNSYNRSKSIFFIETSDKARLTSREACALESAARWDIWTK